MNPYKFTLASCFKSLFKLILIYLWFVLLKPWLSSRFYKAVGDMPLTHFFLPRYVRKITSKVWLRFQVFVGNQKNPGTECDYSFSLNTEGFLVTGALPCCFWVTQKPVSAHRVTHSDQESKRNQENISVSQMEDDFIYFLVFIFYPLFIISFFLSPPSSLFLTSSYCFTLLLFIISFPLVAACSFVKILEVSVLEFVFDVGRR